MTVEPDCQEKNSRCKLPYYGIIDFVKLKLIRPSKSTNDIKLKSL